MPRFVFGPQYGGVTVPGDLPDLVITGSPTGAVARTATFTVPPFDPAAVNVPTAIHVAYTVLSPDPQSDPAAYLASVPPAQLGTITAITPGEVSVTVPGVPAGTYVVQSVLEFAV